MSLYQTLLWCITALTSTSESSMNGGIMSFSLSLSLSLSLALSLSLSPSLSLPTTTLPGASPSSVAHTRVSFLSMPHFAHKLFGIWSIKPRWSGTFRMCRAHALCMLSHKLIQSFRRQNQMSNIISLITQLPSASNFYIQTVQLSRPVPSAFVSSIANSSPLITTSTSAVATCRMLAFRVFISSCRRMTISSPRP